MSRFFSEAICDIHTNSSSVEIVNPPPRSEAAYKAICSDFKKFFLGFLVVEDSGVNGLSASPYADIQMFFMPYFNPIFIETLKQTLEPMLVSELETSEGKKLFFDTRKLPDEHLLWSYQGRMDFFHELMHNLIQATIENIKTHTIETDDIGDEAQNSQTFLARISQEMPHFTEEKILGLLNDYFNVFQKDFDASTKFERKYQILESLVKLYVPLHYYGHFREFITYREQCRLNWLFKQSPLSSLLPEMKEKINSYIISTAQF